MRIGAIVLAAAVWLLSAPACAQGATEVTQGMNFMQLVQLAMTAESQLRQAQYMTEQMTQNMERLSRGDVTAIRDLLTQAMMVQSMASGFLASQRSAAAVIEYTYPSPTALDGRFQTWSQYHQHMRQVERENHRTYEEAARLIDTELFDGLREDGRLLQRLREKAGSADSEAKQLQVTNQILLELVRQMHMLRTEALAAHRMDMLVSAADSQRRIAAESANESLLKPARMKPSYAGYTAGGTPVGRAR